MKISINLELSSLDQVDAIQAALELYADMETDRSKDKESGWSSDDAVRLKAARDVLSILAGGKASK